MLLTAAQAGVVLGIVGLGIAVPQLYRQCRRPAQIQWRGLVYIIGASCLIAIFFEFTQIGPLEITTHAADFGFAVFVAMIVMAWSCQNKLRQNTRDLWALSVACLLSFAYECFSHDVAKLIGLAPKWTARVGQFDEIDLALYALGTILAIWLLLQERRELRATHV